jgi:dGTPase
MKSHLDKKYSKLKKNIRKSIDKRESKCLSEFACKNIDAIRRHNRKAPDIRAEFSRDSDRILHTHAYTRYIDKTQVFSLVDNDHITHRVLHVQFVSKIARTIGRALKLNEDLIEAISLGHDIGHVPFGHEGEAYLSSICLQNGLPRFLHNVQSVRFLDDLEDCDLTLQVLDGILCHNGEIHSQYLCPDRASLRPNRAKDWDHFDNKIEDISKREKKDYRPMTLEGCVVRFSDTIAYAGRDVQDAIEVGILREELIPSDCREILGTTNGEIINTLILDIIENSQEDDKISYSREVSDALDKFKKFNYQNICKCTALKTEEQKAENMFNVIYKKFLHDLETKNEDSKIFKHFILMPWINKEYLSKSSHQEKVRDFIAGMTDRYFETIFKDIVLPKRVSTYAK